MSDLVIQVIGHCGRITLDRPRALNALTQGMVDTMLATLLQWSNDDTVAFVLVDGAGERGLCAGGDIRAMYNAILAGQPQLTTLFFHNEYRLNALLPRLPKPYVVLMDGIVMGGGIGVSAHGSHRIVTERSTLAMPETTIGFVPDVGGTYLLGVPPGELGTYMGLTGERIGAADAILCGLADFFVPSGQLPALTQALEQCQTQAAMEDCLRSFAIQPPPGMDAERLAWIGDCFAAASVEEILTRLAAHPSPAANTCAEDLQSKSPTSLKVTLQAIRNGRTLGSLDPCLQQEFRLAQSLLRQPDFVEGVRAAIVDKDRNPKWQPATLEAVSAETIHSYLAHSPAGELDLSFPELNR